MQETQLFTKTNTTGYLNKLELIMLKDLTEHYQTISAKDLAYIVFNINKHNGNANVISVAHVVGDVSMYKKLCSTSAVHIDAVSDKIKVVTPHRISHDSFDCPLVLFDFPDERLMSYVLSEFKVV